MPSRISAGFVLLLSSVAAWAETPQDAWKKAVADQNSHYAQAPHAMLKIQDAVYLGDGDAAALQGRPGQPASWRWTRKPVAGPLQLALKDGKLKVQREGKPLDTSVLEKGLAIDKDIDLAGQPTQVGAGIPGWRIFIYNQNNPAAKDFRGVSYFPYDGAYRVTAQFVPDVKLPARVFHTSRGTDKQFHHAGDAVFLLKGKKVTLPFYADSNRPDEITEMSAFFTDDLTGQGAYGAGRYVDVDKFGRYPPARVTLDLNFAYNPNCARSPYFTCPVATDVIPMPVAAGERDPHGTH